MGQMKDLMLVVEDLLDEGYDEAEIAAKLDLPLYMIEEVVAVIDEIRYHEDMDTVTEAQEWHDYDPDC